MISHSRFLLLFTLLGAFLWGPVALRAQEELEPVPLGAVEEAGETAVPADAVDTDFDTRIAELQAEVEEQREVLDGLEAKAERKKQTVLVRALERELDQVILAKRQAQLAQKQAAFERQLRGSAAYALREALRAVDSDAQTPTRVARRRADEARVLRSRRAVLEERLRTLQEAPTPDEDAVGQLHQQIANHNEEILVKGLQRDLAELQSALIEHGNRIDELVRSLPLNPVPTVRMLIDKKRYISGEQNLADDMATRLRELERQRDEISEALELTRERQGILEKSESGIFRSSMQKLVAEKLRFQRQQLETLDESISVAAQAQDLFIKEVALFEEITAELTARYWRRLLVPVGIILLLVLIHLAISRLVLPRLYQKDSLFIARRLGSYSVALLSILVLAVFFLEDLRAIATVMGIAGAAVVIALQDLCSSFAGCFVIITSRKFQVGDRVEIDAHRGDVIDIQLLRTTLLELHNWLGVDEPTGRIIIIPNSFIFKSKVINYSHVHPYIWGRIDITVTFETPAQEAHDLLMTLLEEETKDEFEAAQYASASMAQRYGVEETLYHPKIYSVIADSGVLYSLLYVCHYKRYSAVRNKVNKRIIQEFDAREHINFAYPTERHIPTPEGPAFPVQVQSK